MLQGVSACAACPPLPFRSTHQPQQITAISITVVLKLVLHIGFTSKPRCCYEVKMPWWRRYSGPCPVIYTNLLAFITSTQCFLPALRASLWSSCVVLPLLALTWMSAVLAMTDKRSILFQILFAVFDSLQGFVIVMVHCILRREVEDGFKSLISHLMFFSLCKMLKGRYWLDYKLNIINFFINLQF